MFILCVYGVWPDPDGAKPLVRAEARTSPPLHMHEAALNTSFWGPLSLVHALRECLPLPTPGCPASSSHRTRITTLADSTLPVGNSLGETKLVWSAPCLCSEPAGSIKSAMGMEQRLCIPEQKPNMRGQRAPMCPHHSHIPALP